MPVNHIESVLSTWVNRIERPEIAQNGQIWGHNAVFRTLISTAITFFRFDQRSPNFVTNITKGCIIILQGFANIGLIDAI